MNPDMNAGCHLGLFRANTKESLALGNLQDVEGPTSTRMYFTVFFLLLLTPIVLMTGYSCSRLYVVLGINWTCQHES